MRLTSSSLPGPFSVSHSTPVAGSTHSPNEFRCPIEYAGLSEPSGLSDGVLPSGLSRRTFPPRSVRVLGALLLVHLADRDVELPVAAEHQVPTVVIAVLGRERVQERLRCRPRVVGADTRQAVQVRDGIRVVDVDPRLRVERGIEREAQQALFARRQHVDVRDGIGHEFAVADHADVAGVLLREEQTAVRCERHVRRERQAGHDGFERCRGVRARGRDDRARRARARSPKHPSSVARTTGRARAPSQHHRTVRAPRERRSPTRRRAR